MWTASSPEDRALVADLSKDLIAEVAPEELDLFDQLAQEYFEDPKPPAQEAGARDDALGFGLNEVLAAATPAAHAMVSAVIAFAIPVIMKAAQDQTSEMLRASVKSLFKGRSGGPVAAASSVTFSREQLQQMHAAALAEARRFGLSTAEAERMADALFRRMAIS